MIVTSFLIVSLIFQVQRSFCARRHSVSKSLEDDDCFKCLCIASSECDSQVLCHSVGDVDYFCGPYQVSRRYWTQAGSPGANPDDPFDFEECVNNIYCAIETVKGYFDRWSTDCDDDKKLTCYDLALVHKGGPKGCSQKWVQETKFWSDFTKCAEHLNIEP